MTYVITEACVGTKDLTCIEVCPVDCIHPKPGEEGFDSAPQLYIDPISCIDCDACVAACPVDACFYEALLPPELERFTGLNAAFFDSDSGSQ
jgi:ferredoxin